MLIYGQTSSPPNACVPEGEEQWWRYSVSQNCNHCIQRYPKLHKRVYHMCIPTYSSFVVLRAQFPSPSFPCSASPDTMKQWMAKTCPFFHGFHVSHVYPNVPECVSCVYPKNEKGVFRVVRATHYFRLWRGASIIVLCSAL